MRRLAGVLVCLATAAGADWRALKPEGYVSDFARVVDEGSKRQLENYLAAVERQTGAQIALVTVRTLDGDPIEDAANTLFRAWGVGQKGVNNGVLLLLAVQERRSRLEIGYEIEPLVPDSFAGQILDEMRPALRQQQYGEAFLAAAQKVGSTISQAKGVTIDTALRRRIVRRQSESIPWPVVGFAAVMVLLFAQTMARMGDSRRRRYGGFPFFLPPFGGGSGRSSGGGGFGGYDSGDSFGGFGGGDSGGGGASSDW